jgi:Heavy-metal-associated domain
MADSWRTAVGGRLIRMPSTSQPIEIPQGLCRRCVRALSRRLRDLPGVVSFEIDAAAGRVWISGEVDPAAAHAAVDDLDCS